ncbi:MAG: hypothetical protein RIK87_18885 [Fuerstiella sp.]
MVQNHLPSLIHLDRMTDSTGIIQHGIYSLPRRESGYTTDDNARALRFAARLWKLEPCASHLARVACYLSFMEHTRSSTRGFHNFMGYQRDWLDSGGTEDCQGQAVLALAEVLASDVPKGFHSLAIELLKDALPATRKLKDLRAIAYLVQAWHLIRKNYIEQLEELEAIAHAAAERLMDCYGRSRRDDWFWFESRMTYANAVLPHALFDAAELWDDAPYLEVAQVSFGFLSLSTSSDNQFCPIGNRDWFSHGEEKSTYDQQPVEASTMAACAHAAWRVTGNDKYLHVFERSHAWFLGKNSLGLPLADAEDGSCCDGLTPHGVNGNQGAESTLAWLWTELLCGQLESGSIEESSVSAHSNRDQVAEVDSAWFTPSSQSCHFPKYAQ